MLPCWAQALAAALERPSATPLETLHQLPLATLNKCVTRVDGQPRRPTDKGCAFSFLTRVSMVSSFLLVSDVRFGNRYDTLRRARARVLRRSSTLYDRTLEPLEMRSTTSLSTGQPALAMCVLGCSQRPTTVCDLQFRFSLRVVETGVKAL